MRPGVWIGLGVVGAGLAWLTTRLPGCRQRGRDAGAVLLLTTAVALFFWPVLLAGHAFPKGGGDLWGQLYPVWAFIASQVRRGVFPLWDPLLAAGDPILSEGQYGLFNPLNWPLFLLSPPPVEAVLLRGMVGVLLAGVGMYLYLTRSPRLRLTTPAGLAGGVAYMLSDPLIVHLGHPQINDAIAWLPWSFLGVDWALEARSWRRAALGGVPLALMALAGHGQVSLYGLIAAGLYGLWAVLAPVGRGRELPFPLRLGRLALAGMVGFALSAPMTLPGVERLPWTVRSLMPRELRRGYEFLPALLADSLAPYLHGRGVEGTWFGVNRVEKVYVGAVALYLAVLGVLARPRRALFWLGLGGLAVLFAVGHQGPLYPLVADWPLFAESWKTARAVFIAAFSLALLAGLGGDVLACDAARWRTRGWTAALVGGGIVLWIAAPVLVAGFPAGQPAEMARLSLRLSALLALGLAGLGWAWLRWRQQWTLAGVVALLIGELVATGSLVEADPSPPLAGPDHGGALAFLQSDPGWFRVDTDPTARHLWSPEVLQVQGFETLQGSGDPLALYPLEQFYWSLPSKTSAGYRLLGIKYIIVAKGEPPGGEGIWPVFIEDEVVDVHLNTLALPRVWLVYRTEPAEDFGEAFRRVLSPDFRPEEVAVVEGGPRLEGEGNGTIEVGRYSPNEVVFVVHTDAPALLVLSDVYYPGWRAEVDREPVPIYRTDATFRGVLIPPGDHRVRMRFFPRSLQVGLALAAGAAVLLALNIPRHPTPDV